LFLLDRENSAGTGGLLLNKRNIGILAVLRENEDGTLNETANSGARILPSLDARRLDGTKYLYQVLNHLDRLDFLKGHGNDKVPSFVFGPLGLADTLV
jgi:hypothetical protein